MNGWTLDTVRALDLDDYLVLCEEMNKATKDS